MTGLPDVEGREQGTAAPRRTVAIIPGSTGHGYPELLHALEEAYAVRFVGASASEVDSAEALIVFPGGQVGDGLRAPRLVLEQPRAERGLPFTVELSRSLGLDRALHGQRLLEAHACRPAPVGVGRGWRVLATADGKPIWAQTEADGIDCEIASALPLELEDNEFLRDHLSAGRFWSLLPIVHFLKRISSGASATSSAHNACFVIDDPNLRFSSYGCVRFPDLARDAREGGYHVAVATIPLDLLLPGSGAVGVVRSFRSELSLAVHGNDHVHRELERHRSADEADRLILSADSRVRRFEERTGISIERVMCPPHGGCGHEMLAALFRCEFLGLAASRPFPWDGFADQRRWRLGGWLPAQFAGGGLPVLPRYHLSRNPDDLVFRAFRGQPLIVYCHHEDLCDGLEPLRAVAARIAELGDARWMSLASIAGRNALCSEQDGVSTIALYSRDLRIPRPAAPILRVEVARTLGAADLVRLVVDGERHDVRTDADGCVAITLSNPRQQAPLRVQISAANQPANGTSRDWRPRAWPLARRAMTETRDRALPLVRALRR